MTNEEQYKRLFGIGTENDKLALALQHALDIRKFEIELYWKKATYFWALIAVTFAGYFAVLGSERIGDREYLAYVIALVGYVFSWAWFLVNKGSKFWQENWENHVDMLEDEVTGPLFKTILHRPDTDGHIEKHITGPATFSAGKTNQWVGLFTIGIWLSLIMHSLPEFSSKDLVSYRHVAVGLFALATSILMYLKGKTHLGGHHHEMHTRKSEII